MSFTRVFSRYLGVALADEGGVPVTAFRPRPTPRCQGLLAEHGLAWRADPGAVSLFYQSDPDAPEPLIGPIAGRLRLTFGLELIAPDFLARHHPDFGSGGKTILLDTRDAFGAIQPGGSLSVGATVEEADLVSVVRPSAVPVVFRTAGGLPDRVIVEDRFTGEILQDHPVVAPAVTGAEVRLSLDLGAPDRPDLRLTTSPPVDGGRLIYADAEVAAARPAAILDLWWEAAQDTVPPVTGATYTATFRRR